MANERNTSATTTQKLTGIKLKEPANYAAGVLGVKVALDHAIGEMGVARAMKMLAKMNQKDGFDCPGCAWPDPDDKRSLFAEYCENGAKALAEELGRLPLALNHAASYIRMHQITFKEYIDLFKEASQKLRDMKKQSRVQIGNLGDPGDH